MNKWGSVESSSLDTDDDYQKYFASCRTWRFFCGQLSSNQLHEHRWEGQTSSGYDPLVVSSWSAATFYQYEALKVTTEGIDPPPGPLAGDSLAIQRLQVCSRPAGLKRIQATEKTTATTTTKTKTEIRSFKKRNILDTLKEHFPNSKSVMLHQQQQMRWMKPADRSLVVTWEIAVRAKGAGHIVWVGFNFSSSLNTSRGLQGHWSVLGIEAHHRLKVMMLPTGRLESCFPSDFTQVFDAVVPRHCIAFG